MLNRTMQVMDEGKSPFEDTENYYCCYTNFGMFR
jgi:hypothetical protein